MAMWGVIRSQCSQTGETNIIRSVVEGEVEPGVVAEYLEGESLRLRFFLELEEKKARGEEEPRRGKREWEWEWESEWAGEIRTETRRRRKRDLRRRDVRDIEEEIVPRVSHDRTGGGEWVGGNAESRDRKKTQ